MDDESLEIVITDEDIEDVDRNDDVLLKKKKNLEDTLDLTDILENTQEITTVDQDDNEN